MEDNKNVDSLLESLASAIEKQEVADYVSNPDSDDNRIYDRNSAEFYMKKYIEYLHKEEEIREAAEQYINNVREKVDKWVEKEMKSVTYYKKYIGNLLQDYAWRELQSRGGKSKTIHMIEGSLSFRKARPTYEYDEEKIKEFLIAKGDKSDHFFIKQEPKINISELKKAGKIKDGKFYLDDEEVEGITVTENPDIFKISDSE